MRASALGSNRPRHSPLVVDRLGPHDFTRLVEQVAQRGQVGLGQPAHGQRRRLRLQQPTHVQELQFAVLAVQVRDEAHRFAISYHRSKRSSARQCSRI